MSIETPEQPTEAVALTEDYTPDQPTEATNTEPEASETDWESKASEIGWKKDFTPKSPKIKTLSAQEWVEKYEQNAPIIRSVTRDIKHRFESTKTELEELKKRFAEQQEYLAKSVGQLSQTSYERDLAEIEARLEYAVENGDTAAWKALDKRRDELKTKYSGIPKPPDPPKPAEPPDPNLHPDMQDFVRRNPWYQTDADMADYANSLGMYFQKQGYTGKALLKQVETEVRRTRPEKFENPARQAPSAVNEGDSSGSRSTGGYALLPADARAECDRYCKKWVGTKFKTAQEARNNFVKLYNLS